MYVNGQVVGLLVAGRTACVKPVIVINMEQRHMQEQVGCTHPLQPTPVSAVADLSVFTRVVVVVVVVQTMQTMR